MSKFNFSTLPVQRPDGETPAEQLRRITDEKGALRAQLAESQQRVKALEDAVTPVAIWWVEGDSHCDDIPAPMLLDRLSKLVGLARAREATCQK